MRLQGGDQELERIVHPHPSLGGDPRRGAAIGAIHA
jgi:hypothetical protein